MAVVLRFFQGQGNVLLQITCYTVITNIYSGDIMNCIGYLEIAVGVDLGAGPTLGSLFNSKCSYAVTMYVFGVLNLVALFICGFMIPSELNRTNGLPVQHMKTEFIF